MIKLIRKNTVTQVGIWLTEDYFEFLWFDQKNRPHFYCLEKDLNQNLEELLIEKISTSLNLASKNIRIKFITAILPHQVWSKTLLFQNFLSEEECHQQSQYILQKELPFPLEELWFDYMTTPLKQGMRMDIFAIRIEIAQQYLTKFYPFKIDVLDTLPCCLSKALRYLSADYSLQSSLFLYQDEQHSIALQNHTTEWRIISKTRQELTALYQQFNQHYAQETKNILIYQKQKAPIELALAYQIIESKFPLIPLGASLWQKDLYQNEKLD